MIEVHVGDAIVEFPDDTPKDVMEKAIRRRIRDVGIGTAFGIGALQGATANFGDEFAGLLASQIPTDEEASARGNRIIETAKNPTLQNAGGVLRDFFSGPVNMGRTVFELARGQETERTKRYEEARDAVRETEKAAREQYPVTTLAGGLAGGLVVPASRVAQGATMGGRMVQGALTGAAYGGLSGVGGGESAAGRAVGGAVGTVLGAGIGAVAPPIVEGVVRGGQALAAPVVRAVRGIVNPAGEASRRVGIAIEQDLLNDPNAVARMTGAEFNQAIARGEPAALIDLGGETTKALARSSANTSPSARAALNQAINERFEGQGARIIQYLRDEFNFPNALAQQEAIEQTARNVNRVAYRQAYQQGAAGLWSPELERLAGSGAVNSAMQAAARNAGDEAIVAGYGAMNPRISFTPDGRIQFNRGPNGVPTYPDLQYWDLVRRELSDAAQRAGRGTSEARRLNNFANALNAELDRLVPSYAQARQGAAYFFGAENALEAGQNFVLQNFGNDGARRALARMSPTERQLFQDGFVSRFVETLERVGDRRNILNQIAANPAAREKLNIALGPQRAATLEARLRVEGILDLARSAVQGNSTTARQLIEIGLAGGVGGYGYLNSDPQAVLNAAFVWGAARGKRVIDERVAAQVARMLTSSDPRMLLLGIRMLSRNNSLMTALRSADAALVRAGVQQAPVPAIQGPGMGRAEEDQPSVPRPPGQ
jgi:hypothetical protein